MWRRGALPWPFGPGAAEGVGSHPAAGVAIDAGVVHVEVTLLGRDPRDPRDQELGCSSSDLVGGIPTPLKNDGLRQWEG